MRLTREICQTQEAFLAAAISHCTEEDESLLFAPGDYPSCGGGGDLGTGSSAAKERKECKGTSGAIAIAATDSTSSPIGYNSLIIRSNRIRSLDGETPVSGTLGIVAKSVGQLAIDNNLVEVASADSAVQRRAATAIQVFNNRSLSGDLLPVSIIGSSLHQGELTTEAELMYATL